MDGKSICRNFCLALLVLGAEIAAASAQTGPAPNGMKEKDHLRNVRYCEVFVVRKHFFSTTADVYNTLGLNDCPAEKWASLDTAKLKKEWNVAAVILNGPRYFIMDRNAIENPGKVESFDGLDARLLAELEIKSIQASASHTPKTECSVKTATSTSAARMFTNFLRPIAAFT
jgi:hypothetical protein